MFLNETKIKRRIPFFLIRFSLLSVNLILPVCARVFAGVQEYLTELQALLRSVSETDFKLNSPEYWPAAYYNLPQQELCLKVSTASLFLFETHTISHHITSSVLQSGSGLMKSTLMLAIWQQNCNKYLFSCHRDRNKFFILMVFFLLLHTHIFAKTF